MCVLYFAPVCRKNDMNFRALQLSPSRETMNAGNAVVRTGTHMNRICPGQRLIQLIFQPFAFQECERCSNMVPYYKASLCHTFVFHSL